MATDLPLLSGPRRRLVRGLVAAMLPAVVACLAAGSASAQAPASAASPDAKAILMGMADYMSKLKAFSVDVRDSYDTYQTTGQKIEYAEQRAIVVARPDRLRIDVVESNGDKQVLIFDGKNLTLSNPGPNVFAQTPVQGNLDTAIVHFVRDLGMRLPFAAMLLSTASADIAARTKRLDYVEKTSIYGAPAYHLAGRTEDVDFQIWIADGDKPLPMRLVLTYVTEKGEPQFRAQFSNWNLAPQITDAMFAFTPPPNAQRIAFLAELPRSAAPVAKTGKPSKPTQSGEKK